MVKRAFLFILPFILLVSCVSAISGFRSSSLVGNDNSLNYSAPEYSAKVLIYANGILVPKASAWANAAFNQNAYKWGYVIRPVGSRNNLDNIVNISIKVQTTAIIQQDASGCFYINRGLLERDTWCFTDLIATAAGLKLNVSESIDNGLYTITLGNFSRNTPLPASLNITLDPTIEQYNITYWSLGVFNGTAINRTVQLSGNGYYGAGTFNHIATGQNTFLYWGMLNFSRNVNENGLVAEYHLGDTAFNESLTARVTDSSGNNQHLGMGNIQGIAVNYTNAVQNNSLTFSGVRTNAGYAMAAATFFPTGNNPVTLEAWVYPRNVSSSSNQFGAGIIWGFGQDSASPYGYILALDCNGQNVIGGCNFSAAGPSGTGRAATNFSLVANQWYHVVGVYNGTHNSIYINGLLNWSRAYSSFNFQPGNVYVSAWQGYTSTLGFNGSIDTLRAWSRALSPSEVSALYNSGCPSCAGGPSTNVSIVPAKGDWTSPALVMNSTMCNSTPSSVNASYFVHFGNNSALAGWDGAVNISLGFRTKNYTFNASNLSAYWDLGDSSDDEAQAGVSYDLSGNNRTLTYYVGSTSLRGSVNSSGVVGKSLSTTWERSYLMTPVIKLEQQTLAAWVYLYTTISGTGVANYYHIIRAGDDATSSPAYAVPYTLVVNKTNYVYYYSTSTTGDTGIASSNITLTPNRWYFLVGTWNGTNNTLYIDGNKVGENASIGTRFVDTLNKPLSINGWYEGSTSYYHNFQGMIDNVMIFNRSLSWQEVLSLYNNGCPSCAGGQTPNWTSWSAEYSPNLSLAQSSQFAACVIQPRIYFNTNSTNYSAYVSSLNLSWNALLETATPTPTPSPTPSPTPTPTPTPTPSPTPTPTPTPSPSPTPSPVPLIPARACPSNCVLNENCTVFVTFLNGSNQTPVVGANATIGIYNATELKYGWQIANFTPGGTYWAVFNITELEPLLAVGNASYDKENFTSEHIVLTARSCNDYRISESVSGMDWVFVGFLIAVGLFMVTVGLMFRGTFFSVIGSLLLMFIGYYVYTNGVIINFVQVNDSLTQALSVILVGLGLAAMIAGANMYGFLGGGDKLQAG